MFQSNLTYLILKRDQPLTFFQHLFLIDLIQSMTVFSNPHKESSVYSAHPYCTSPPHQTLLSSGDAKPTKNSPASL